MGKSIRPTSFAGGAPDYCSREAELTGVRPDVCALSAEFAVRYGVYAEVSALLRSDITPTDNNARQNLSNETRKREDSRKRLALAAASGIVGRWFGGDPSRRRARGYGYGFSVRLIPIRRANFRSRKWVRYVLRVVQAERGRYPKKLDRAMAPSRHR